MMVRVFALLLVTAVSVPSWSGQDDDPLRYMDRLDQILATLNGTDAQMAAQLGEIYQEIFELTDKDLDLPTLKRDSLEIVRRLFLFRLRLKHKALELASANRLGPATEAGFRNTLRLARYADEMIAETHRDHWRLGENEKAARAFSGSAPELLINPRFGSLEMRSGDVILMRGNRYNSAAIARIGDSDSQFSHTGIIYIDPTTGRGHFVESLIEKGLIVRPLEEILNEGVGRMMLFRYNGADSSMAQRAAASIYQVAIESKRRGERIDYDFSMRMDDFSRLFCSKVITLAFLTASGGSLRLPRFPSMMTMRNRHFFERTGVEVDKTFAPGDLELEPSFDVVAEWRDLRVTPDLRIKDMVLTKIFEWMERDGVRFENHPKTRLLATTARTTTMLPFVRQVIKLVFGELPSYITVDVIETMIQLQWTADPFFDLAWRLHEQVVRRTGAPAHPRIILSALESEYQRLRRQDGCAYYLR